MIHERAATAQYLAERLAPSRPLTNRWQGRHRRPCRHQAGSLCTVHANRRRQATLGDA